MSASYLLPVKSMLGLGQGPFLLQTLSNPQQITLGRSQNRLQQLQEEEIQSWTWLHLKQSKTKAVDEIFQLQASHKALVAWSQWPTHDQCNYSKIFNIMTELGNNPSWILPDWGFLNRKCEDDFPIKFTKWTAGILLSILYGRFFLFLSPYLLLRLFFSLFGVL